MFPPISIDIPLRPDSADTHRGYARIVFADHAAARAALVSLDAARVGRVAFNLDTPALTTSAVEKTDKTLHAIRERLRKTLELNSYYASLLEQHGYKIHSDGRALLRKVNDEALPQAEATGDSVSDGAPSATAAHQ